MKIAGITSTIAVLAVAALLFTAHLVYPVTSPFLPPPTREPISIEGASVVGSPEAPIVVVEFGDFQSSRSRGFALRFLPDLRRTYIASGQVQFAFKHLPLQRGSYLTALAADCGHRQGQFWSMHDELFGRPSSAVDSLDDVAGTAGVNMDAFRSCLAEGQSLTIRHNQQEATRLDITDTPTILIGRLIRPQSVRIDVMLLRYQLLDRALRGVMDGRF